MKRKINIAWLEIYAIIFTGIVGFLIAFYINLHKWIILGGLLIGLLITIILVTWIYPFILIINENYIKLIGFPWIFKIKLDNIEKLIWTNYSFFFIPVDNNDCRWICTHKEGEYKGYKFLGFLDLKGWGRLIDFFKPIKPIDDINWDNLKENEKTYIEKILYD